MCLFPPFFSQLASVYFFLSVFFLRCAPTSWPHAQTHACSKFGRGCGAAHLSPAILLWSRPTAWPLSLWHPGGRLRDTQSHALRKTVNEQNFTVWWFTTGRLFFCLPAWERRRSPRLHPRPGTPFCFFSLKMCGFFLSSWFGTHGNTVHCVISPTLLGVQYKLGQIAVNALALALQLRQQRRSVYSVYCQRTKEATCPADCGRSIRLWMGFILIIVSGVSKKRRLLASVM